MDKPSCNADSVNLACEEYEKLAAAVIDCLIKQPNLEIGGPDQPAAKRARMASGPNSGASAWGGHGWGRGRGGGSLPFGRRGS